MGNELVDEDNFTQEARVFYMQEDAEDKSWRDSIRSCDGKPTPEEFSAYYDEVATLQANSVTEVTFRCDHASPYETTDDLIENERRSILPGDVVYIGRSTHIVRPRGAEKASELNNIAMGADE